MKFGLITLAVVSAEEERVGFPSPAGHTKFAGGFFKGVLSDDAETLSKCQMSGEAVATNLVAASQELKAKKFADAVVSLQAAFDAVAPAKAECKAVEDDVKSLSSALKHLSPKTVEDNIKANHADIMTAIGEANKNRKAEDFDGEGMQMGKAFKMLIQEETLGFPSPAGHTKFAGGFFKGVLSDDAETLSKCQMSGEAVATNLVAAAQELKAKKFADAVGSVQAALNAVAPAKAECKAVEDDVKSLSSALKHLSPKTVEDNIKANHADIMTAIGEANKNRKAEDFDGEGVQMGKAFKMLIHEESVLV